MKTSEELTALKEDVEAMAAKLTELTEEELEQVTGGALCAMQSSTPGVQITTSSGQPGKGFRITIRGIGTIGDTNPLYVIDGVSGSVEPLDNLKDAFSTAIYGSRGTN